AHALRAVAALPARGSPVADRDRLPAGLFGTERVQPRLSPLGGGEPDRVPQGSVRMSDGAMQAVVKAGPVVLITGASSGIGRRCAEYLHERGCRVYGTSRRAASATDPSGFNLVAMDVTDEASVQSGIDAVLAREGRIDVVLNNAGDGIAG